MRIASVLMLLSSALSAAPGATTQPSAGGRRVAPGGTHILDSLAFEENRGQIDRRVQFVLRAPDYTAFFLKDRLTIAFRAKNASVSTMSMKLCGRDRKANLEGLDAVPIRTSYFLGRDPARWVRNAPHYARLRYRNVYPRVDLVFHLKPGKQLEYDWVVAPGGDPAEIRVRFDRDANMVRDDGGDLVAAKDGFAWRHRKPAAYQQGEGTTLTPVAASFRTYSGRTAGFDVSAYDRTRTLKIDPVVVFSIVFGGHGESGVLNGFDDAGNAVAYNPTLNSVYVAGAAVTQNFPTGNTSIGDPFQVHNGGSDAFVAWVTVNGAGASNPIAGMNVYFLGGSLNDGATGVGFDPQGNVYITGYTSSTDFPLANPMRTTPGGGFAAKFTSDFSALVYSTYIGSIMEADSDRLLPAVALAVDSGGNAYATGEADPSLFTATPGAFQTTAAAGSDPAFALKLDPTGKLVYATFLGNDQLEWGNAVAVDASSDAYVVGYAGNSFPTTPGVVQPTCGANSFGSGCNGGFVTKLNASGSALIYSTFLGGGTRASANGVAVDAAGNAYVAGDTVDPQNFPTTTGAFQQTTKAQLAAFVTKLNPTGTALVYSTLLAGTGLLFANGSSEGSQANAIALDAAGGAYVTGATDETDFPLVSPPQTVIGSELPCQDGQNNVSCGDAFISKLNPNGSALEWSTYLGGSDWDDGYAIAASGGDIYVTGVTVSYDFPGDAAFPDCTPTYAGCAQYPIIPGSVFLAHLNESAEAPGLTAAGITNAASFVTGVTPGGLVTIFGTGFTSAQGVQAATCGPLPGELGGVSVAFGTGLEPAPLLAVTSQQINLVAPWDLDVQSGPDPAYVPVTVYVNGVPSLPIMAAFAPYQPAFYLTNGTYAAAQHSTDYSLVTASSPAQPGEVVILYANGLGAVQPAVALGSPAPSSPPAATVVNPVVTIGGAPAVVLFSGLAPGFVDLYQLNVRVPAGLQPGNQNLVVTINGNYPSVFTSPTAALPVGPAM